jgi:phosphoribosyl 1,2-cyclic phosphate phosphodiesterase
VVSKNHEIHSAAFNVSTALQVTLLGTGTSQGVPVIGCKCDVCCSSDPRDRRTRTSAYIRHGETCLLIDIGPDFRHQMLANQLDNVHAILLTHEHNDHTMGLDDIRPVNFLHKREMPLFGSPGALAEMRSRFAYAFDEEYKYPGKPSVKPVDIGPEPFSFQGIDITPIPADHGGMPVYGYRIGRFAYLTDAKVIPDSSKALLQDLDVLVLNALRHEPHPTHLHLKEAVALCDELKPRRAWFTHISHSMGLHAEVEETLPDEIHLGYDNLIIDIGS